MVTVSLKMTEQDKTFLQAMAKFEGLTLSELIRSKTLSALEDEYDARIADQSLLEYENYLNNGGKEQDINELWGELNL